MFALFCTVSLAASSPAIAAWKSRTGDAAVALIYTLVGAAAASQAALYAQAYELQEWAVITLMLLGTVIGAGHPSKYLEYLMEVVNAAMADVLGDGLGSATTGLVGGILAVFVSGAAGAAINAVSLIFEASGVARVLLPVGSGFGLCVLVTLVPDELELRRIHAFYALCTSAVAVAITYQR